MIDCPLDNGETRVSIHAPVMDANSSLPMLIRILRCFNPRARDGREKPFLSRLCER